MAPDLKERQAKDLQGFRQTFFRVAHMSPLGNEFVARNSINGSGQPHRPPTHHTAEDPTDKGGSAQSPPERLHVYRSPFRYKRSA